MSYKPSSTVTEGGQEKTWVADMEVRVLLELVLRQLQKMNVHLSLLADSMDE